MNKLILILVSSFGLLITLGVYGSQEHQATLSHNPVSGDTKMSARTFYYQCAGDYTFVARLEGERIWLFLPGRTVQLPHVPSASGARYGDGTTLFWSKGEEALLNIGAEQYRDCRNNRGEAIWEHAKLNGVDFRGVGNEPGWYLEIRDGRSLLFVSAYGKHRHLFPNPERESSPETRETLYTAFTDSHSLRVILKGETCQDSMADSVYATRVRVELDGKVFRGCGRPLH